MDISLINKLEEEKKIGITVEQNRTGGKIKGKGKLSGKEQDVKNKTEIDRGNF